MVLFNSETCGIWSYELTSFLVAISSIQLLTNSGKIDGKILLTGLHIIESKIFYSTCIFWSAEQKIRGIVDGVKQF